MLVTSNMHDFTPTSTPSKRAYTFSHFLRRKPRSPENKSHESPPPPPPPKDQSFGHDQYLSNNRSVLQHVPRSTSLSLAEFHAITQRSSSTEDRTISAPPLPPKPSVSLPPQPMTAAERAQYREEARRRREREEREIALEEQARQARALRQKKEMEVEAAQLEERRKAQLAHDLERARLERERKEQIQRAEEEWAHKQTEERKLQAKQRRLEEGRKMQEWRDEQERRRKQLEQEKEEENRRHQQEWLQRLKAVAEVVDETSVREGWVTMQTSPMTPWRRRWYKFVGQTVFFYRSPQDKHTSLDTLQLSHHSPLVLRQWRNSGYEELKAMQHSFALEFSPATVHSGDSQYWSFFADTEQAEDHLLGLFCYFGDINLEPTASSLFFSKIPRWKENQF